MLLRQKHFQAKRTGALLQKLGAAFIRLAQADINRVETRGSLRGAVHCKPVKGFGRQVQGQPLCLVCDDAELLEAALRAYQGRALYEGTLPEAALLPLCDRYGLLI